MTGWFAKNLGDAMLALDSLDRIETLYSSLYGRDDSHQNVAVFIRHESEGRLHCARSRMSGGAMRPSGCRPLRSVVTTRLNFRSRHTYRKFGFISKLTFRNIVNFGQAQ